MQIGPADTRSRDPDDGVLRMQDLRHGFMVYADPQWPSVIHGEHRNSSFLFLALYPSSPSCKKSCPRSCSGGFITNSSTSVPLSIGNNPSKLTDERHAERHRIPRSGLKPRRYAR